MRPSPQLAPLKHEIPVFLEAVRTGSKKDSLLALCEDMAPLLSMTAPSTLRQQWLRWTAPLRVVIGKGPKPQQIPTLDNLTRIYNESIERAWIPASVPGAEQLCGLLKDEFTRCQAELTGRIKRKRKQSIQAFIDELVDDYLQEEEGTFQLWRMLPQGIGEALGEAVVRSLEERLVFERPEESSENWSPFWAKHDTRHTARGTNKKNAILKAFNEFRGRDAFSVSARMTREIVDDFSLPLKEYAQRIEEARTAAIEQERAEFEEMVESAKQAIAERGPKIELPRKDGPFIVDSRTGRWTLKKLVLVPKMK